MTHENSASLWVLNARYWIAYTDPNVYDKTIWNITVTDVLMYSHRLNCSNQNWVKSLEYILYWVKDK